MTSIKPPSGPSGTLPHTGVDLCAVAGGGGGHVETAGGAGATGSLAGAEGAVGVPPAEAQRVGHGAAAGLEGHSPLAATENAGNAGPASLVELARAVECGQLSMAQAVDRLVESTVGSLPGKLTELERTELSELLRQALASDPTLSALRNEQGG